MSAVIYSKNGCPFCVRAKQLLAIRGVDYVEYNMSLDESKREELLEACAQENVVPRTVPQIWLDDKYIGGYDQLAKHFDSQ